MKEGLRCSAFVSYCDVSIDAGAGPSLGTPILRYIIYSPSLFSLYLCLAVGMKVGPILVVRYSQETNLATVNVPYLREE